MRESGQIAYEAFVGVMLERGHRDFPTWRNLDPDFQEGWREAARTVFRQGWQDATPQPRQYHTGTRPTFTPHNKGLADYVKES